MNLAMPLFRLLQTHQAEAENGALHCRQQLADSDPLAVVLVAIGYAGHQLP